MTMNTVQLDGFVAVIRYDPEKDRFRGETQWLHGGADFYGTTPKELRREFRASLDFFIATCEKHGTPIKKPASGKFVVRIPSDLYAKATTAAQAAGLSLNALVEQVIRHEIHI